MHRTSGLTYASWVDTGDQSRGNQHWYTTKYNTLEIAQPELQLCIAKIIAIVATIRSH